tara:strand:- start:934 stop:1155 length:222 start_codon:yes stop_codon:yes gene_type:complete
MIYIVWLQDMFTMTNPDLWAFTSLKDAEAKEESLTTIENMNAGLRSGVLAIPWANTKKRFVKNFAHLVHGREE